MKWTGLLSTEPPFSGRWWYSAKDCKAKINAPSMPYHTLYRESYSASDGSCSAVFWPPQFLGDRRYRTNPLKPQPNLQPKSQAHSPCRRVSLLLVDGLSLLGVPDDVANIARQPLLPARPLVRMFLQSEV